MGLVESIEDGKFSIVVEFTARTKEDVVHVAEIARGLVELNKKYEQHGIVFTGVSLTQNPGGNLSYDHQGSLAILRQEGFPESLEVCPHITGKDMNVDAVHSLLIALSEWGITHILALTGDISDTSQGVFEIDSLGLLQMVRQINVAALKQCKSPESFSQVSIMRAGAVVSPFKYTDGSLAMQYIKAQKKVREGAAFLTCQCGWDADRSEHLINNLTGLGVPLIGNVLVVTFPVARYMQTLAGCVVSPEFLEVCRGKKLADALQRAGQQLAMFRQLGYAGADLGKPGEFKKIEDVETVIDTALAIDDWRRFKDNLTFPMPESPTPRVRRSAAFSKLAHKLVLEQDKALYGVAKAVLTPFNKSAEREGVLYRLFKAVEGLGKGLMYQCEHCGDCFLPENDYICTMGECEKGLNNPPCGDADPRGYCGNNESRICVGETLYYRLLHYNDLEEFKKITLPARKPDLKDSASLLNFYFGRDHVADSNPLAASGLISMGQMLHAAIPLTGMALKYAQQLNGDGFRRPNRGLMVLEELVAGQAGQGADYLVVNVDSVGGDGAGLMRNMVRLIHRCGQGVPPCIDSSDPEVLTAGLDEWFSLGELKAPLVGSIPCHDADRFTAVFDLRKQKDFGLVCLLAGSEDGLGSADEIHQAARQIFGKARAAGFGGEQVFVDPVVVPLTKDGCNDGAGQVRPSHTHNCFQAIRKITNDPQMGGAHCVLAVSRWAIGVKKRRVGHIRAFVEAAKRYGLDAGVVDTAQQFGVKAAPAELVELVESFAALDGSQESTKTHEAVMAKANESAWI